MIVSRFTNPELEYFRQHCNFVNQEIDVFEMRSKDIPLEKIAEHLNMSIDGINKISRRVNRKISKTL
jgi:transcriptional regulator